MPLGTPRFVFRDDLPAGHDFIIARRSGDDHATVIMRRNLHSDRAALRQVRLSLRELEEVGVLRLAG